MVFERVLLLTVGMAMVMGSTGCRQAGSRQMLQQSQLRSRQLYEQNRMLSKQMNDNAVSLAAERDRALQQNIALKQSLDSANQRLDNLLTSNNKLEQQYRNLMASARTNGSPLSAQASQKLQELRARYPQFEFDPQTGVSRFNADLLFATGSDDVRPEAQHILQEFAKIMNQSDARHLNVLVVGHTDDRPIAKPTTKAEHATNWHLSTNRANSVVMSLKRAGISETRMGSAGYSMHQPVNPNADERTRQRNRRVELFVLAPDASVAGAGWDPLKR